MTNPAKDLRELERIKQGDAEAFARIYGLYWAKVYGFAYRMLGNQPTAEDITHETFLVIIQNPESYRAEQGSLLTFLCAIARNQILNHFRRRGIEIEEAFDQESLIPAQTSGENNPLSSILEQELVAKVNEAIALLPILQRETLILREFQELSYEEISVVTEVEINVVKARLYRARQSLAKKLAPYMKSKGESFYELRRN